MLIKTNRKHTAAKPFDFAALLLGAGLFLYLLLTVRYTEIDIDEAAYLSLPQRLLMGDRLLIDEWGIPQLSFLPIVPIYWLFTNLTGSTEGILYFMRVFFVCTWALFYVYLYKKLKSFGAWGLAGAFLFCALVPQTIMSHSYYTMSGMAAAAAGCAMLPGKHPKKTVQLILLGAAAAIGILTEPALISLYFVWFALTVVREIRLHRKKTFSENYVFLLNRKTFLLFTIGAAAIFFGFIIMLAATDSLLELPQVLPYLLSDGDYNAESLFDFMQIWEALRYFGWWFSAAQALVIAISLILAVRGKLTKKRTVALLSASCALLALSYVYAGISSCTANDWTSIYCFLAYHNIPLLLFSPIPFILTKKMNSRFFTFWLLGVGYSLLVDISSKTNLGSGGNLTRIPLLLQTAELLRELNPGETPQKRKKRDLSVNNTRVYRIGIRICAVCAVLVLLWNVGYIWIEGMEKGLTAVKQAPDGCEITQGPYRYMKMPANEAAIYRDTLQDLDILRNKGGRVCIPDQSCFMYLYLELPYATYHACYKSGNLEKLYSYWQLSPQHRPDWIYLSDYEFFSYDTLGNPYQQKLLDDLQLYMECEITRGQAGFLVHVTRLKSSEQTTPAL